MIWFDLIWYFLVLWGDAFSFLFRQELAKRNEIRKRDIYFLCFQFTVLLKAQIPPSYLDLHVRILFKAKADSGPGGGGAGVLVKKGNVREKYDKYFILFACNLFIFRLSKNLNTYRGSHQTYRGSHETCQLGDSLNNLTGCRQHIYIYECFFYYIDYTRFLVYSQFKKFYNINYFEISFNIIWLPYKKNSY